MEKADCDETPEGDPDSRRDETNKAFAKMANEEKQANQVEALRQHHMKLLGWPPTTNRG